VFPCPSKFQVIISDVISTFLFHFPTSCTYQYAFVQYPTQPPIQLVPGALFVGVKRPGREADYSPHSSAEVKECVQLHLHSPNTPSWRGTELRKAQGQLYLTLLTCPPVRITHLVYIFAKSVIMYAGRLQSSWTHLITPSRDLGEVW
jgi:hypothetical protein